MPIAEQMPTTHPAIRPEDYFEERAKRGSREAFLKFLDGAGNKLPIEGDELGDTAQG
jgi:hypothetical protein